MLHLIHQHPYLSLAYLFIGLADFSLVAEKVDFKLKNPKDINQQLGRVIGTTFALLIIVTTWPLLTAFALVRRALKVLIG